jgi:hypothetical protein
MSTVLVYWRRACGPTRPRSVAPRGRRLHGAGALSSGIESPIRDCFTHLPTSGRWVSENGAVASQTKTITHQSSRFRHSSLAQRTRSRLDFAVRKSHSGLVRDAFKLPFKDAFMCRRKAHRCRLSVRNATTNDAFGCRNSRAAGIERACTVPAMTSISASASAVLDSSNLTTSRTTSPLRLALLGTSPNVG